MSAAGYGKGQGEREEGPSCTFINLVPLSGNSSQDSEDREISSVNPCRVLGVFFLRQELS